MTEARAHLCNAQIIVLKIGTSSLTFPNGLLHLARMQNLVKTVAKLQSMGKRVVLVSSGSIAVGVGKLGFTKEKPKDLPSKQAAAAVGQAVLMKMYQRFFSNSNTLVAQVLLTNDIMRDSERKQNVINTFATLLEMGAVPIVNENDTIATEEIVYGDNDTLSAVVATLCNADLLILLSDIDGLFTADPKRNPDAQRISIVPSISDEIIASAGSTGSSFGTGGMATKITAAKICHDHGIDTVIANAKSPEVVFSIIKGEDVGTLFLSSKTQSLFE